jgi:hypothetical protein
MEYIIVGTEALESYGIYIRESGNVNDLDIFCSEYTQEIRFSAGARGKTGSAIDKIIVPQSIIDMIPHYDGYATPAAILTIKCSHLGWDIFWQKHKNDVLRLYNDFGMNHTQIIRPLYDALVEHWKNVNGNKEKLDMYQTRSDFFNNAVPYVYDHEWLHKIAVHPNRPIYLSVHEDGQEVAISQEKFLKLSFEDQVGMFKEEIAVIAIERWMVNPETRVKYHWIQAWNLALHKVMTALTKDWSTDFMVMNLKSFVRPDFKYFKNFYERGIIDMATKIRENENDGFDIIDEIIAAWRIESEDAEEDTEIGMYEFVFELGSFGEFKSIESVGGEDEGSYAHFIFEWKGKFYKLVFAYYSNDGYQFDYPSLYEVVPTQVTETKYV